jgi:hypothetical protein
VWLLEELSTLIRENIGLRLPGATGIDKCYHPGFGTLRYWINSFLEELGKKDSSRTVKSKGSKG